jgi:rhamnulose-1-phosphate aldolase/alcohol dehydrogenase
MTRSGMGGYHHVRDDWDDEAARGLDPVERLVYRSNLLGGDRRITNTGGGNTSSKLRAADPITGEEVDVLWVKGSGGDLRTTKRDGFASLDLARFEALRRRYLRTDGRGPKTSVEDAMVDLYRHAVFGANPRAASIDTPLHALVPYRHVDHTHPDAVVAIAASRDGRAITEEVYGDEVGWVDWMRPGFELGLEIAGLCAARPGLRGVVMGQHGLICWDDDDRRCYATTLELIDRAARFIAEREVGTPSFGGPRYPGLPADARRALLVEALPGLRGLVSTERGWIATVHDDERVRAFVDAVDAPRLSELGTSCPDHFLRTKIKPLYVDWAPRPGDAEGLLAAARTGLDGYRAAYADYYRAHAGDADPPMRDPNPTVLLLPGIGMVAFGRNKSESRVTAEFFLAAIEVMRGAEALGGYVALPRGEAFDIEYWRLEEAKLRRMPPEAPFERRVAVVVGAGSGIGKATALRLAQARAHVVCADIDAAAAEATARELTDLLGLGIGVAGTGIAGCGPAIAFAVDVTERTSVRALFEQVVLAYGGVDAVAVTAGIYPPTGADGRLSDAAWARTFDVNVFGAYLVADEARRVWQAQGTPGSLLLTTSVNAVVAKAGSLAYDTSKAAAQHLVRELAVTLAPLVRVNALAPATVVDGSSMFSRERVIGSLRRYGLPADDEEPAQALRQRLAEFYAQRTLTKAPITVEHQAEAAFLLLGDQLSRTTGQVLTVDGGLNEAFLR